MSDSTFYKRHCIYFPAMAGWFITSAALSSYNKVIFGQDRGAFPCPLLLTSLHFFVQWVFSYSASALFPDFFGGAVVKKMSWKTYLGVSIPCGFITAADVGMSNLSLVRISITFFTMVKSSAPIWVLLSAFIFGLEKITCNLMMVGFLITAGEVLTAFGEVEFDTIGFLLCGGAAICGGIRWTLVQFKLQKLDPPLEGPVVTMRVLSSTMFFSMLLLSFIIEQPWNTMGPYFSDFERGMKTVSLGLIGAFIAITMVLCEFWLILKSNAIVLMIGGVLKEMITIFVGVTLFGDELNIINISGIAVVFLGVFLYKVTLLISKMGKENLSSDIENNTHFSRINGSDVYEDEPLPHRAKRSRGKKNSDPDIALTFMIEDEDIDEEILMNNDGASPLRGRMSGSSLELGRQEQENSGVIT
mmetsp:Transcript_37386/g.67228  ORF Transcript_37386/g.67228 Transcript_37386/m.67228 type:complete len:415 (-) Transcript_37386:81-1325(-)